MSSFQLFSFHSFPGSINFLREIALLLFLNRVSFFLLYYCLYLLLVLTTQAFSIFELNIRF